LAQTGEENIKVGSHPIGLDTVVTGYGTGGSFRISVVMQQGRPHGGRGGVAAMKLSGALA
jgi:hypothetical protein